MIDTRSLETLIDTYCAAWSESDALRREAQLAQVLTSQAHYTDPRADVIGIAALSAHIGTVLAKRPGARVVRTSAIDAHHDWARFGWRVVQADGTMLADSVDIVNVSADGKLGRILGFFGPLAAHVV